MTNPMNQTHTSSLKLTFESVRIRAVSVPLRRPVFAKVGTFHQWPLLLIDVYTREGVTGHSYLEPQLPQCIPAIHRMLDILADKLQGKPLAPLDAYGDGLKSLHLLGREGVTLIAISGVDMAIWDALARACGLPLSTLLGGQPGPVRAYNTTGLWLSPIETLGAEAKALVAQGGFNALKMRLGRATVQEDLQAIRCIRDAVGPDIHLMSDFNQSLTYAGALHRLRALDDQGLYWFEEPVVYDQPQRIADITRQIQTPVQIGENIYGPRAFYQSVAAGTADLYMPDLMRIGGVTGWMRAAAIAGAAGLPLSSHLYASVSSHLLRASETADWLEWSDWADPILEHPCEVKDGVVHAANRPGNGIEWNEAAVAKYAI